MESECVKVSQGDEKSSASDTVCLCRSVLHS